MARALVGSEGTWFVLEATVRLVYSPPVRTLVVLGYPDMYSAGDHVTELLAHSSRWPGGLRRPPVDDMKRKASTRATLLLLPEGRGWLLVEFGGETQRGVGRARRPS